MLFNHSPKCTCIGRANGFSFKENGCATINQGSINNIRMSYYPTHIRSRPEDITRFHIIDIFHRIVHCHGVSTIIPNNSFWFARCARSVENIQWVCGINFHTISGLRYILKVNKINITPFNHGCQCLWTL